MPVKGGFLKKKIVKKTALAININRINVNIKYIPSINYYILYLMMLIFKINNSNRCIDINIWIVNDIYQLIFWYFHIFNYRIHYRFINEREKEIVKLNFEI